jgi:hypothetical protein
MSERLFLLLLFYSGYIVHATEVCSATSVSALAKQGSVMTILGCLQNSGTMVYLSQSDIANAVTTCLDQVMDLAPTYAPASATQCRACYKGLINDLFALMVGTINSGVFVATASPLPSDCMTLTTVSGVELCLKSSELRNPLLVFQKCSGYAIMYPANGNLSVRRLLSRADIFGNFLRFGLGSGVVLTGDLSQVLASVNSPATPQSILLMELCYLTFLQDLVNTKPELSLPVIADCSSNRASDVCLSDSRVIDTIARFTNCAGFRPDTFPVACSVDILTKVYGNYDVLAVLIPLVILNFASATPALLTSIQNVIASIALYGTDDCSLCFQELAIDVAANIQRQQSALSLDQFSAYISGCSDPHSKDCGLLIGTSALQNFEQCSGSVLDLMAYTTKTPPVPAPSTTTSTTSPVTLTNTLSDDVVPNSSKSHSWLSYWTIIAVNSLIIPLIL